MTSLAQLLGPGPDATQADVIFARNRLSTAIAAGQPEGSIGSAALLDPMQLAVGTVDDSAPGPRRAFLSGLPLTLAADGGSPRWARGMASAAVVPSLVTPEGLPAWLHFIKPQVKITVVRQGNPTVLLSLPHPSTPPTGRGFEFGPGAPIAADEVVHMHWRWGLPIPLGAKDEALARTFRGYSDQGDPNVQAGAPLIPSNQSLRIKIAHPLHDVGDVTSGPIDLTQTVVWYSPTLHEPKNRGYTQFCGHGFGFAYRLKDLNSPLASVTNADLLGVSTVIPNYHSFRWNTGGAQRIPTARDSRPARLSRNRLGTDSLGTGLPAVNENDFNFG